MDVNTFSVEKTAERRQSEKREKKSRPLMGDLIDNVVGNTIKKLTAAVRFFAQNCN